MNNEIYIIGGGASLKDFDFVKLKDKDTIAVNMAALDVPNPTYCITLDYTFLRKLERNIIKFRGLETTRVFIVDFHHPYLKEKGGRIVDTKHNLIYNLADFHMIIKAYKATGIGFSFNDFRTGINTGYCALQLAVLLGYTKIYLLGIDLVAQERTHYHEGYGKGVRKFNKKLITYLQYFKDGLKQIQIERPDIEVISCSPISGLNNIIKFKEFDECP